jgi:Kdo2-lipid IVA lauroyltransferase/acyltransferase
MDSIGYYLFYPIYSLINLLPLRVLYLLSDFLFLILYYFPSYRRNVVETNLKNAFPEKSEKERKDIEKRFYKHLADMFVETFKVKSLSRKELEKRFTYTGLEIVNRLYDEKRDIIAVLGHYNNWELSVLMGERMKSKAFVIYKPLRNKNFDRLINSQRTRFGLGITPMSMVIKEILRARKDNINTISMFLADQSPPRNEIQYWTTFLNQDTAVYTGAEKIARKYNMAVVFFHIRKIKRGHYNMEVEELINNPEDLPENMITEAHVRRLEEIIRENPEYWAWSHRRWKHKKPLENV